MKSKFIKGKFYPVIFSCSGRKGVVKFRGPYEKTGCDLFTVEGDIDTEPYYKTEFSWIGNVLNINFPDKGKKKG